MNLQKWYILEYKEIQRRSREGSVVVLDSSAVEHSAVNRSVVGSNPTRGVKKAL